ncbi:zinc-binding dehydrogenase [Sphingomonas sp. QA11]|uniref:zinc-binding dehydrogenase n=1 Tax=Sphingomonas sp. QA11 TaxID=2950605 RepID=UPI00234A4F5B|nr:zinc-binding dehydrogenase [Sphingomonas sp. QA11]WCM25358.1 zinc-binding dehydrogenase [Sphingomonas sp. QA11]
MTITTGLQISSLITPEGELRLSLDDVAIPAPGADQIVVRMEAAPLNPSDLGLLLGPADLSTIAASGTAERPLVTASVNPAFLPSLQARIGEAMAVGNEGAGIVVDAGDDAKHLIGRTVAVLGGSMYSQYRVMRVGEAMVLPEGTTAAQGASCFVNPLTALAMVETMRAEGHTALVHTAAASNLGQMLNRICIADGVPLVNVVRSEAQAKILTDIGAKYVVDSTTPDFRNKLVDALMETGATLAFDAVGGGPLAGQLIAAMEIAATRKMTSYSRYGSTTHKQVYIYGVLDTRPTEIGRNTGMAWGVGGFLLTYFLMKAGQETGQRMRARVTAELTTTFASHYTSEISLAETLQPETIAAYARKATGEKFLINPNKGL